MNICCYMNTNYLYIGNSSCTARIKQMNPVCVNISIDIDNFVNISALEYGMGSYRLVCQLELNPILLTFDKPYIIQSVLSTTKYAFDIIKEV